MTEAPLRVDKWLWFARFFKSRTLAAKVCSGGRVRLNGQPIAKPHHVVRVGDILTFPQARDIRVVRIVALGLRRGPASEAYALYEDLEPPVCRPPTPDAAPPGVRDRGAGRPTKADRRAIERLRGTS